MKCFISSLFITPDIFFTSESNRKFKKRQKEREINKISKLYPEHK